MNDFRVKVSHLGLVLTRSQMTHQQPNNCLGIYSFNSDLAIHTESLLIEYITKAIIVKSLVTVTGDLVWTVP